MNPNEKSILAVTCFGHFATHFNMLVFPALVLPLSGLMGLEVARVLELSFWMYLLFGLTALPWGLLADRVGAKPLLMVFFLGSGLSGFSAAWFIDSPAGLSLSLAGIGFFSGVYHPAGLGMISKGVERVSLAMGYNGMFGNLGLAAAPLVTGLVNWAAGPGMAYAALGVVNLAGLFLMMKMPISEASPAASQANDAASRNNGLLKPFIVLLAAMMLGGVVYRGSTVIMPTFFELKGGAVYDYLTSALSGPASGNLVATAITSFVFLLGVAAQYLGGKVGERFELRWSYLVFHAVSVPAAVLTLWATGNQSLWLIMIYMFFLLGMQPIENTLVGRYTPAALRHAAFGAKFIFTFGVGSFSVWLVGALESTWGIDWVFPVMGFISMLLVGSIAALIQVTKNARAAG